MERRRNTKNSSVRPRSGKYVNVFSAVLLALSLGLGSAVSGGCVAVPAVMLTTAAVTGAALVSEGERLVQYPDAGSSVFVENDTAGESTCRQTCQRHEAPTEKEDLPDV
jgi:hypothetical protein